MHVAAKLLKVFDKYPKYPVDGRHADAENRGSADEKSAAIVL